MRQPGIKVSLSSLWSVLPRLMLGVVVVAAAGSVVSPGRTAGSAGLVAAYAFDEGAGATAADASGNGHTGTISNATWTSGRYGDGLSFNGTSSLVTIPDSPSLDLAGGMTLEAWVDPSVVSSAWRDVLYKGGDAYYLEATSSDAGRPVGGDVAGGRHTEAHATTALTPNGWAFLTATYDGAELRLYVNGTDVADTPESGNLLTSTGALQIGGDTAFGQFFAGAIDQVRIYSTALSAGQIQADMTTPLGTTVSSGSFNLAPAAVELTPSQTQQFTASTSVAWAVDGIVGGSSAAGTITSGGLYSAPASAGTHTVTATSLDGTQAAEATVHVSDYAGTFTFHNDNMRDGENLDETVLTPATVSSTSFGKLFSYPLDGLTFASPLYVENVNIPGQGVHNVVYVETEHDSVYAFDADGRSATPLWHDSFINPSGGVTPIPPADTGETKDIPNEIGITGTPVIDRSTNTMYVVAATKEVSGGTSRLVNRLHALDLTTGAEKLGGPVVINPSVPGTGVDAQSGTISFNNATENQRAGLLLENGELYVAFANHGFEPPYHGWLLAYNPSSLHQDWVYCTSANAQSGGIWMGGDGVAADASGSLYFSTGNGTYDGPGGGGDYGDSLLKLNSSGTIADYFTPYNYADLDSGDTDLASGGIVLLPDQPGAHPHEVIAGGKGGTLYLVDRDSMGHVHAGSDSQIVQSLINVFPTGGGFNTGNYSSPTYFDGVVYYAPISGPVMAFTLTNGRLSTSPSSESPETYNGKTSTFSARGGETAISADGTSNGILWAMQSNGDSLPGTLHAYDPKNLALEYYTSDQAGTRDQLDPWLKFTVPLVANGRVYVVSAGQLTAFGLLPGSTQSTATGSGGGGGGTGGGGTGGGGTGGGGTGGGGTSGGGTSGGGGQAGTVNMHLTLGASPQPHAVGDQFAFLATIVNNGSQGADSSTLTVNLPAQVSLRSTKVDRGPGCGASGQTVTCPLDFFPAGLTSTVVLNVQVTSLAALTATASIASTPADSDTSDNTASMTVQLGPAASAPLTPPALIPTPKPAPTDLANLLISGLKPVSLHPRKPRLTLVAKVSKATELRLSLLNSKGHTVARWAVKVRKGTNKLSLLLPTAARHKGHDRLRITAAGDTRPRTLPLTLSV